MSTSDIKEPLARAASLLEGHNPPLSTRATKLHLKLRAGRLSHAAAETIREVATALRAVETPGWPLFRKTAEQLETGLSNTNLRH